jgi:hypothetical protein
METITEVLSEETQQEKSDSQFRGVEIPPELAAFPESSVLYPKLLLRVSKPERLRQFGIDDLAFRLGCQAERERRSGSGPDVLKRAGIWYLVASKNARRAAAKYPRQTKTPFKNGFPVQSPSLRRP